MSRRRSLALLPAAALLATAFASPAAAQDPEELVVGFVPSREAGKLVESIQPLADYLSDALGVTRPVKHPSVEGLDDRVLPHMGPTIEHAEVHGRATGFSPEQRIDMAEGVLKAMGSNTYFIGEKVGQGSAMKTVNRSSQSRTTPWACSSGQTSR